MYDIPLFLLKSLLPVGLISLVFFSIGLLLARMIWGRNQKRLSNAIDESMNLTSQWSALGSSQQDLFKKLRVRWQADRNSFEKCLSEKDSRISILKEQIQTVRGKSPNGGVSEDEIEMKVRLRELESQLASEKAVSAKLREDLEQVPEMPVLPFAVKDKADAAPVSDRLETRILELEQDLVDTHNDLHQVRSDYERQSELVESLEARLIQAPAPEKIAEAEQIQALFDQRSRELRLIREQAASQKQAIAAEGIRLEGERRAASEQAATELREEIARLTAEHEQAVLALQDEAESRGAEHEQAATELREEIARLTAEHEQAATELREEIARLTADHEQAVLALKDEAESRGAEHEQAATELREEIARLTAEHEQAVLSLKDEAESRGAEHEQAATELREEIARLTAEHEQMVQVHASERQSLESKSLAAHALFEEEILQLHANLESKGQEFLGLQSRFAEQTSAWETAQAEHSETEAAFRRRRESLQSEINDVCHELFDVRQALNDRIARMATLEQNLAEQSTTASTAQERNIELEKQLGALQGESEALKDDLKTVTHRLEEATEALSALRTEHEAKSAEASLTSSQLLEIRKELSETKIALDSRSDEHQKSLAQIEELETVLEERTTEVSTLSEELRRQRDELRQIKDALAQTEGELEALVDESRVLGKDVQDRQRHSEEQALRMVSLESALAERYRELNEVRVAADLHARDSQKHESRVLELEEEVKLRDAEIALSNQNLASAESSLETANASIADLSDRLAQSEVAINDLRSELEIVSKEKVEVLSRLEEVTSHITELEEAAQSREEQLSLIDVELTEHRASVAEMEPRIERLQAELKAAEEGRLNSVKEAEELAQALRESDERSLALSLRVDEKEKEITTLREEASSLQTRVDTLTQDESDARERCLILEKEVELKTEELTEVNRVHREEREARELEMGAKLSQSEDDRQRLSAALSSEIDSLRVQLAEEQAKASEFTSFRETSDAKILSLRQSLDARLQEVQELQTRLNDLIKQRASRDREFSEIEEKLRSFESLAFTPVASDNSYEALLTVPEGDGIPLDDLAPFGTQTPRSSRDSKEESEVDLTTGWAESDTAFAVFFDEGGSELRDDDRSKIDQAARAIRGLGREVEVTVIGYAGAEGSSDFNKSLSAQRADAVRERFIQRGILLGVVKVQAVGQDRRFSGVRAQRAEIVISPVTAPESVN